MRTLAEIETAAVALEPQDQQTLVRFLLRRLDAQQADGGFDIRRPPGGHSILDIKPVRVGRVLQELTADDDLLGEMLEGRHDSRDRHRLSRCRRGCGTRGTQAARATLARLLAQGDRVALAPQVLAEFIHVYTASRSVIAFGAEGGSPVRAGGSRREQVQFDREQAGGGFAVGGFGGDFAAGVDGQRTADALPALPGPAVIGPTLLTPTTGMSYSRARVA